MDEAPGIDAMDEAALDPPPATAMHAFIGFANTLFLGDGDVATSSLFPWTRRIANCSIRDC
jgi:hypothetical protein